MTFRHRKVHLLALCSLLFIALAACGERERDRGDDDDRQGGAAEPRFGEVTTVVVVVNPYINDNSSIEDTTGSERADVPVAIYDEDDEYYTRTDSTGLAVLEDVPVGSWDLEIGDGYVPLEIFAEGELYDVVVSLRDGIAEHLVDPVRYPIGGDVVWLYDGDSLQDAIADDTVIFLEPGHYDGGFELREENVLLFGAWHPEDGPQAIIDGDIEVRGEPNRFRSIDLRGEVTSRANNFSMSFSYVDGADITGQGVSLIRNKFPEGAGTTVPSDDAVLVDNDGIP